MLPGTMSGQRVCEEKSMSQSNTTEIIHAAVLAERERIAQLLDAEGDMGDCYEDNLVMRDAAWLVRADFSYEEVERLQAKSEAEAQEACR